MREALDTALVRIRTRDGEVVGSGFLVGERQVLTCAHVIAQALGFADDTGDPLSSQVHLDFPQLASHTLLLARVVFWLPVQSDSQGDIAGLELLDEPPAGAKPVHLAPADQVWGHPFRALGFPHGYDDGVWATGRLLGRQGTRLIQLEDIKIPGFPVMSGFSGAPVWDEQLQGVVGMIALASQAATTKTAFAIPSDVLVLSWPQLPSFLLPSVPRNPYKGLDAFTQDDTRDFFGRDALVDTLATAVEEALTHEQQGEGSVRLLAVLGASGSGKSSVMMAGLVPRLRAGGVLNSQDWVYLDPIVPGADPLEALLIALKPHFPDTSFHTLRQDLEENVPRGLHLLATQLVNKPGERAVLLIDQFEEIFTLTIDEAKRQRFFDLLVTAVTEPHGPLFIILTLRADLYDRPMQYPELYRLIDEHHVSVLPMGKDELRSAIEGPAHLPEVQLTFEGGLIEELLFAVEGQSGALPLLEFTLDQLVRHRDGQQLTLHAYHEMGEVKGALSQYAEEVYQRLPSNEHRETARDLFLRLIHPGITEQDTTRRRAWYVEFEQADSVQTLHMQEVMERFIRARLLTGSQISGNRTIEVSHEALIREWKRLAAWLREARADILFQQSLSEDVAEWEQRERPRDRLYRGVQFKEAQDWASRNRPSKQEAVFLQASARQRILSRVSLVVLACVLLSSPGGAGWFFAKQPPDPTLVTTLQDNVYGSLRYCVESAPTGSTIRFAQGLHGTIDLKESLSFPNGEHLTIQGPGAGQLTISGARNSYSNVIVPPGATLTLAGLSFKNSQTIIYAFIENEGALTVTQSIISNNSESAGSASYGGGIFNNTTGTLTVNDSTFSGNSSISKQGDDGQGGAINNEGKLTVVESTFSQNTAVSSSGNSFGGGIVNYNTGTSLVRISGSIIAANTAANGPDISGVLISGGYNLLTNIAGVTGLNTKTDKQVTIADLKLDTTLHNNGGPTQTLALLPGSPAIDAIPLQVCHVTFANAFGQTETITADQRGGPRPDGSENACDIGAYESSYQG